MNKNFQKITNVNLQKEFFANTKQNSKFGLNNRRYLGNKFKLLDFIKSIVAENCGEINSFCDIFSGTGTVGYSFNDKKTKIIANDLLSSNYVCLSAFLGSIEKRELAEKIKHLNQIEPENNYFSENFGGTYFSVANAQKIGTIRAEIDKISVDLEEKNALICSLIYATDRVANTVGHYDAFRKKMDSMQPLFLKIPNIEYDKNIDNEVFNTDSNLLVEKIDCDVLYLDPPYNSRQYSDAYHLLENLTEWKKPEVFGVAKKMDRKHIKSKYCTKSATDEFELLIRNANAKHILLSYNNTAKTMDDRSNARINDNDILRILKSKGETKIYEKTYKAFTTGRSKTAGNTERIFYCKVK